VNAVLWQPVALVVLNLYAVVLVLLRAPLFHTKVYRPMLLNIGLSLAPGIVLSLIVVSLIGIVQVIPSALAIWLILIIGGLIWLLLLPNSAYLITELNFSHRKAKEKVPLWYDIVLVLTLALSGTMNTLTNVAIAQIAIATLFSPNEDVLHTPGPWIAVVVTLLLVAFGIYLGRSIRFNSWDIVHPTSFIKKLATHFGQHGELANCLGFVVIHFMLLGILYALIVIPVIGQFLYPQ